MKKDLLNETFNKHRFLLKKKLHEQGVIQKAPIQEAELEEGFKDIAIAGLLGLSTLFNMTSKADTTGLGGQPTVSSVSVGSELARVNNAKQQAESLATELAQSLNSGDDYSKSNAKMMLDKIIKFNKENKLGSAAQMKYAVEFAKSNDTTPSSVGGKRTAVEFMSMIPDVGNIAYAQNFEKFQGEISSVTMEMADASRDALVKKYNTTDSDAIGGVFSHCRDAALGDFMQMVFQKLTEVATRP